MMGNVKFDLITNIYQVDNAMKSLGRGKVFGLDCEWDYQGKGGQKPELLQLANPDGYCALFRLNILRTIPRPVETFLTDKSLTKVGVAVLEDTKKITDHYGVETRGVVDVRHLADEQDIDPRGLSHLAQSVLGINCKKYHYTFHCWTGTLSEKQLKYAALDAIIAAKIFNRLRHDIASRRLTNEWETWGPNEFHKRTKCLWEKYVGKTFNYEKSRYIRGQIIATMLRLSDLSIK